MHNKCTKGNSLDIDILHLKHSHFRHSCMFSWDLV